MAAGTPIVATDVGACREILGGGNFGLVVREACPEAMADGIEKILRCPDVAAKRSQAARARAKENFAIDRMAIDYARVLGLV
jgi:glycosyltransferase involved in cell wall biosynthesis